MSSHHISLDDLPRDGEHLDKSKVRKLSTAMLGLGILGSVVSLGYFFGLFGESKTKEFAYSWLFAFFVFFTLANGAIFWTMLQHLINASWSVAVRRFFENIGANVKWMALFALPFLVLPTVQDSLWEWFAIHREAAHHAAANGESTYDALHHMAEKDHGIHLLVHKFKYLNHEFWYFRAVFYFAFLSFLIGMLRKWSVQQDKDGSFKHTFRARAFCAFPLLFFALSVTFSAIDWIMTMDYTWFSTMWGVYIFAGSAWASMALSILAVIYVQSKGHLEHIISKEHYHLMGKLLLAFTIFWAYISFSQFFLIWYANITEETRFFHLRNTGGWWYLSHILVWGHFVFTFVLLLSAARKKKPRIMTLLCFWVLLMHVVDIYWMIIPERAPSLTKGALLWSPGSWVGDIVAFVAIGGIFGWALLRRMGKASLYPCKDPRLLESVTVTN